MAGFYDKEYMTRQGIVIATSRDTRAFLPECILSCMQIDYPILVVGNNGYTPVLPPRAKSWNTTISLVVNEWNGFELGAIERGRDAFDEFIFLHDTVVIKDKEFFKMVFNIVGSVCFSPHWFHYMGKMRTEVLQKINIPRIDTKELAIFNEQVWTRLYSEKEKPTELEPPLPVVSDVFEEKHGRDNMVVENIFIKKYKATYK